MQTALLKEYVSKAKDLELSCYEQKLLCDNLEQKLSHINYQRKNKENEKKEFKKFGWINYIAGAIGWGICVVPPLIGISGLVAVALYIIAGICDIMHFSIPFIDRIIYIYIITNPGIGVVKLLLNCIIIGAGGGFLLLFLCGIISGSKKNVKKENQKIEENNTNVQKELIAYESKSQIISNNLACARRSYQTTLKTKEDFYSLNIIYPKYRDLVSVGMFDEYLQSGRCYTLEGHEGAYNLYEEEKFKEIILTKLDDIISRLDTIIANQEELANEIIRSRNEANRIATTIENSLQNIENNEITRQYYEEITARNTSYLAWTAYKFNYKI